MAKLTITIEDVEDSDDGAVSMAIDYGDVDPAAPPSAASILAAGIHILYQQDQLFALAEEQVKREIFEKDVRAIQPVCPNAA